MNVSFSDMFDCCCMNVTVVESFESFESFESLIVA